MIFSSLATLITNVHYLFSSENINSQIVLGRKHQIHTVGVELPEDT